MGDEQGFLPYPKGFSTAVCHFAQEPEQWSSLAIVPPICTTAIYKLHELDVKENKFIDSVRGNPNREILERLLAHLENAEYGFCFASGSAATGVCFTLLKQDDHIISLNDIYGGTRKQFVKVATQYGIETTFVDGEPEYFEEAIRPNTKLIWIESPTNPSLNVIDIAAISKVAKKHELILVVDNTFLSPYLQRPLNFGADIVIHSISKYINGHSDVIMGAILTNDEKIAKEVKALQETIGSIPSPFDCSQVLRGLKTLPIRMRQQSVTCLTIAKYLFKHPKIVKVNHPGLTSHPKHDIMKKQSSGHSGMVTFYVKGDPKKFINSLKLITSAGSLGGYNSVVEIPTRMSHASVPVAEKIKLNYTENMIRMSVGLEDSEDLLNDLEQALESC